MARLRDVVVDCRHPASLARFWAAVLDGYDVAPYDDEELARLRGLGVFDTEDDPSVVVEAPNARPRYLFMLVPEPKTAKNRMHADLDADDPDAELERLIGLGARVLATYEGSHIVLADPEGNEFCLLIETG